MTAQLRVISSGLWLVVAFVALLTSTAWAQVNVQLEAPQTVEVGATFQVQAQAMSHDEAPSNPKLVRPNTLSVSGPSLGTSHQISFTNGRMQRLVGTSATWRMTAPRPGEYTIGPASFETPQGRVESRVVRVNVVPEGSLPRRQRRLRSIFDDDDDWPPGFGRRPRSLLDDLMGGGLNEPTTAPEEFAVDVAPDNVAFLRAELSKRRAVVGEQVTLEIYAYGSRGLFQEQNPREARRPKFYTHALVDTSARQPHYQVEINGRRFTAKLLRRYALFPLESGQLEIGPMEISFYGSGYVSRQAPEGIVRQSPQLTLEVVDPPADGRPDGYQAGNVGQYKLSADVQPRKLDAGGSISVVATLEGAGHLPGALSTPEQKGSEWLEPTIRSEVGVDAKGRVGGTRTFTYAVNLTTPGTIDLGELSLPYYDAAGRTYRIARAKLGTVTVEPAADAAAKKQEAERATLSALLAPKPLGAPPKPATKIASAPWFWWGTLGFPFAIALGQGLWGASSSLRRRNQERRASAARRVAEALSEARRLAAAGDDKGACSAIEKALVLDIEDKTGLKARGILRDELAAALQREGCSEEHAAEVRAIFGALDELRFGQTQVTTKDLIKRTTSVTKRSLKRSGSA